MSYAPDTLARPAEWADEAACIGYADIFLPPRSEGDMSPGPAKQICTGCPVRRACLDAAMAEEGRGDHHARGGVRGGLTPTERPALARRMRRTQQTATTQNGQR
ncbi:WhiB family transcriptional regulator [Streptomyces sp. NPDC056638]|uniref:WhiB family transcriptional regulator n=1 Tax=Streptomyces sp. NPDC056638 TaxID=3345887 RepID=UPI0036A6CA50